MFNDDEDPDKRPQFWPRIKTLVVGTVAAAVVGLVLANSYTYFQYGGTMFDRFFEKKEKQKSPMAGKLAFDKGTKYYIGIIRDEGYSQRQGNVYIIEQAGGTLIEVSTGNVEVRDPQKVDKQ